MNHYFYEVIKRDPCYLGNACISCPIEEKQSIEGGIFALKVTGDIFLQGEENITLKSHVLFDKFPLKTGAQVKAVLRCNVGSIRKGVSLRAFIFKVKLLAIKEIYRNLRLNKLQKEKNGRDK